jgi:hypothetical protein
MNCGSIGNWVLVYQNCVSFSRHWTKVQYAEFYGFDKKFVFSDARFRLEQASKL